MTRPPDFVATLLAGSEDAPPHAALEVTSVTVNASKIDVYNVRKSTGDASKPLLFNGPTTQTAGSPGAASNRSHVRGLSGASSGEVGPVNDSWSLSSSATTKTHRVVGGGRSGSYQLERLGGGGTLGDFGVARLYSTLDDSDAVGYVKEYTPILGTDTPGTAPAEVNNPNALEGATNDLLIVTLTDDGWAIAAVLEFADAEHGFCRPYEDFDDGDATIRPAGYQKVEGIEAPDAGTTSVTNPGFSATTSDTLVVAKRSGVWTLCYVIESGSSLRSAIAVLTDDLATSDPTGDVGNVKALNGTDPTLTEAGNAEGLEGKEGQQVLLREVTAGVWEIIAVLAGTPGGLTPCWITSAATTAPESGGDITAQEVTVYLDTLGATPADRVAGTTPLTAYWDDPDKAIVIATGKARRGMVTMTTLGTLDLVFASCTQRNFMP